jgi:ABC-type sugar transport system permease subunit
MVLRYLALIVVDAFALILVYTFFYTGNLAFAAVIAIITIGANIITLSPQLYPYKWMNPGLILVSLLVLYPIFYTVYTAFTNFGDSHRESKQELIIRYTTGRQYRFVPEDASTYSWTLFRSETDETQYALWLTGTSEEGEAQAFFAPLNGEIVSVETDAAEAPDVYDGYLQLSRAERTQVLSEIQDETFGTGDDTAAIINSRLAARPLVNQYVYVEEEDALLDQETDTLYYANDENGFFTSNAGEELIPGYRTFVGVENFDRLVNDPSLRGPLIDIFIWTVVFALLSVLTTFTLGLFMAIVLNDTQFIGKRVVRSLLIIPYAIPGVIAIVIWRGMLNPNIGIFSDIIRDATGVTVPWFGDPTWGRIAVLLVNLWLGYPYMMLICSGALQAIPSDIYEAADVDGASLFDRFWRITLPLLLVSVGPLLIASFVYNFNNYLIIEALTAGDPPIAGSVVPAGYTDILISYTYNSAFTTTQDYGYASAITIVIFLIVAVVTLFQYQYTKTWEEVGENV